MPVDTINFQCDAIINQIEVDHKLIDGMLSDVAHAKRVQRRTNGPFGAIFALLFQVGSQRPLLRTRPTTTRRKMSVTRDCFVGSSALNAGLGNALLLTGTQARIRTEVTKTTVLAGEGDAAHGTGLLRRSRRLLGSRHAGTVTVLLIVVHV